MGYETSRDYFDRETRIGGRLIVQYDSESTLGGLPDPVTIVAAAEGEPSDIDDLMAGHVLWTWDERHPRLRFRTFTSWGEASVWVRCAPGDEPSPPDA